MLPWDNPPRPAPYQEPRLPAPPPQYQPPPAQQMRYDTPPPPRQQAPQRQPAPGIDIGALIQEAVNSAVQQNKQQFVNNAQRAIERAVDKKTDELEDKVEDLEGSFQGGVVTTRTFVQGAAIDIGFAALAAGATVIGPGANVFDKELWTLVGAMVLKTMIQTGMSYMMRLQVK